MVLLRPEPGDHDEAWRRAARVGAERHRHIGNTVVYGDDPARLGDIGCNRELTIELRHRDDPGCQRSGQALDQTIRCRRDGRDAGGEAPSMRRQHDGNSQPTRGNPAKDACLRGVHGDDLGTRLHQGRPNLLKRPEVAERMNRDGEMPEHHDGYPGPAQEVNQRPTSAENDRWRVSLSMQAYGEVPNVNLGAADRVCASHDEGDSQILNLGGKSFGWAGGQSARSIPRHLWVAPFSVPGCWESALLDGE